jgi:GT2 family glycosyltransferase
MLEQQDYRPFEVVVVDNATTDGTGESVAAAFPHVHLVRSPSNTGTHAYELGIRAAKGDYLLMMDDDGRPADTDWISQVVARFEANPRLGAVACTVRMMDTGKVAHDSPQFVPEGNLESGYPCAAYNGTGAGLRAAALENLGPIYPKHYFRTWIELCLCTKLLGTGWEVRHFPGIEVWHCRPSGSSVPVHSYYGLRNYYWYVWQLYPWPDLVEETLHELGSRSRATLQGRIPPRRFWQATRDAVLGARTALEHRQPISPETLGYLRRVRRHGNWHGIAPEHVRFNDASRAADGNEN